MHRQGDLLDPNPTPTPAPSPSPSPITTPSSTLIRTPKQASCSIGLALITLQPTEPGEEPRHPLRQGERLQLANRLYTVRGCAADGLVVTLDAPIQFEAEAQVNPNPNPNPKTNPNPHPNPHPHPHPHPNPSPNPNPNPNPHQVPPALRPGGDGVVWVFKECRSAGPNADMQMLLMNLKAHEP